MHDMPCGKSLDNIPAAVTINAPEDEYNNLSIVVKSPDGNMIATEESPSIWNKMINTICSCAQPIGKSSKTVDNNIDMNIFTHSNYVFIHNAFTTELSRPNTYFRHCVHNHFAVAISKQFLLLQRLLHPSFLSGPQCLSVYYMHCLALR